MTYNLPRWHRQSSAWHVQSVRRRRLLPSGWWSSLFELLLILIFFLFFTPPWFIIPCSSLTSHLLSKWCLRWPRRPSRRSPPRWSSSSPSNFPNPLWQVRGLLIIPQTLHVQAKDNIWNDQRKHILASFRNRIFQILPGSVLPLIMTHENFFVAKYKQFRDKMKMYQSQFSDEISKRILSTLDYG